MKRLDCSLTETIPLWIEKGSLHRADYTPPGVSLIVVRPANEVEYPVVARHEIDIGAKTSFATRHPMPIKSLTIIFPNVSPADGNRLAGSLRSTLLDVDPTIGVKRQKEQRDTQDLGASLAVTLGTAAATALAKGISAWLARNSGAHIEIRRRGEVILAASHLDSKDVSRIVKALSTEE